MEVGLRMWIHFSFIQILRFNGLFYFFQVIHSQSSIYFLLSRIPKVYYLDTLHLIFDVYEFY